MAKEGTFEALFFGLGADGTVGANKNSIKIIGDHTDKYVQAYFDYDSKKSGGLTCSHLRFGKSPITSTYLISKADFVACHNPSYVNKYNMVQELVDGGTFLLNCSWDMEGLEKHLPGQVKAFIANHNIKFYTIDGIKIGKEIGLGNRINTVLQSAFFSLAKLIPEEEVMKLMKDAATRSYAKKGDDIVKMNHDAIDAGAQQVVKVEVPESWKNAVDEDLTVAFDGNGDLIDYVNNVLVPVNSFKGMQLPVSTFEKYVTGQVPLGSSAFEKRGIAIDVPVWKPENCIQCGICSYVCPHATIRAFLPTDEEVAKTITRNSIFDIVEKKEESQRKSVTEIVKELLATGNAVRYNNLSIEKITIGDIIPSSIPNGRPNTRIYLRLGDNVLGEVNELNELGNTERVIKGTDFISTSTFGINLAVGEDRFLRIFSTEIVFYPQKRLFFGQFVLISSLLSPKLPVFRTARSRLFSFIPKTARFSDKSVSRATTKTTPRR